MSRVIALVAGSADIGRSRIFWIGFGVIVLLFLLYPTQTSAFRVSNVSFYLLNIPLGLGMALLWGYCGVLSFGHVAYFGIAGYLYGIIAGNMMGNPLGPLAGVAGGLAASAVVAGVFGYFVFYARVQKWIIPILTLVLTLLLETFLGQTAGYQWRVGTVLLGGYNGMTGIPWFQLGGFVFEGYSFYYLCLFVVLACYFGLRMLVNSSFGQVIVAIREDELRTELLGYDIRARQWLVFVLSAMLAGPQRAALRPVGQLHHAQPGRVAAGRAAGDLDRRGRDRTSLLAVVISSTGALNWVTYTLSSQGNQYAMVIIGALLVVTMMFFPRGIVVMVAEYASAGMTNRRAFQGREGGRRGMNGLALASREPGPRDPFKLVQAFSRRGRGRADVNFKVGPRRAALRHRAERRRQVDAVRDALRHPAGRDSRPDPHPRSGRHRPAGLPAGAAWAWA